MSETSELTAEIEQELKRVIYEWEKRREFLNVSPDSKGRFFIFRSAEMIQAIPALATREVELAKLREENGRLREALKPFGDAQLPDGNIPDNSNVSGLGISSQIKAVDLRRARAELSKEPTP